MTRTEPEESTDLEEVESALEEAETVLRALDELSCHPGMEPLRGPTHDLVGDALTMLRAAVAELHERRRDLDGTTRREEAAE